MSFNYFGNQDANGDYDIVYYNADITNARTLDRGSGQDPRVNFNETRDAPIISDASKYYLSIVRFTMNGAGKELPLFIPTIDVNENGDNPTYDVNQTIYRITLRLQMNGNVYTGQAPLIWVPEDKDAPVPTIPTAADKRQDLSTRYYHATSYGRFLKMMSVAIQTAYDAVIAAATAGGDTAITKRPFLKINDDGTFSWYCDAYGWGSNPISVATSTIPAASEERWSLFLDSNLHGLLSNWEFDYHGADKNNTSTLRPVEFMTYEYKFEREENDLIQGALPLLGEDDAFILSSPNDNYSANTGDLKIQQRNFPGTPAVDRAIPYYVFKQEYLSTGTLWSPIESIVFTSTLLPCVNEFTGVPQRFGDSTDRTQATTQNAFQPIITDIAIPTTSAQDYRGFIEYAPSAEYRMISLATSKQEIKNIDIQVFWKNRIDGSLNPIRLYNNSNISLKIMFRKRDYVS